MRVESTFTGSRTVLGDNRSVAVGPAVPVAWKRIGVSRPLTLAVTSLSPAIVPSVHDAVACPLALVVARRGLVEPLPAVTANATEAPCTARPDASVTVTATAFA